jgi:hypothetical protein
MPGGRGRKRNPEPKKKPVIGKRKTPAKKKK